MKRASLLILASLLLALPAAAQAGKLGIKLLQKADSDKDGAISREEFKVYRVTEFPKLDRNRDGVVSAADIPPGIKKRIEREIGQTEVIAEFDVNDDKQVSAEEFDSGPTKIFDLFDANHDGIVTQTEMAAHAKH